MTGLEALSLLKDGKTLRRESWEAHEKCKALDFLDKLYIHLQSSHWQIFLEIYPKNM